MRAMGTVPLYRAIDLERMDQQQRRSANRTSVDGLADEVAHVARHAPPGLGPGPDAPLGPRVRVLLETLAGGHGHCAQRVRDEVGRLVERGELGAIAQQRVPAHTEAGREAGTLDRLAHQELLGAVAVLVVVVDDAVRRPEAIEAARLALDRQGRVEQLARGAVLIVMILSDIEEHLEGIAGPDPLLVVGVVGVDAQQLLDHGFRDALAQRAGNGLRRDHDYDWLQPIPLYTDHEMHVRYSHCVVVVVTPSVSIWHSLHR